MLAVPEIPRLFGVQTEGNLKPTGIFRGAHSGPERTAEFLRINGVQPLRRLDLVLLANDFSTVWSPVGSNGKLRLPPEPAPWLVRIYTQEVFRQVFHAVHVADQSLDECATLLSVPDRYCDELAELRSQRADR